jgi:uncharacterized membrane protein
LTPERQVGLAALCGVGMICVGLVLRKANRTYASLLPAAGIVILFAAVFGAHLYYEFIAAPMATGCVAVICIVAMWLGRVFDNKLYVLFAVVGAYLTPFLLPVWHANLLDLLIYYSAWSLLFCGYAILLGGRQRSRLDWLRHHMARESGVTVDDHCDLSGDTVFDIRPRGGDLFHST